MGEAPVRLLLIASLASFVAAGVTSAAGESRMAGKLVVAEGMTVHVDPKTGKVLPPQDGVAPMPKSPAEQDSTSTSAEGLKEERGAHGGAKVDLKGRFQNR